MIGIFDSGSGGLTVLRALRDVLPSADVVYFGDIKNAPYGEKTQEELSLLTIDAIRRLREFGADKIVSACNSVSASLALSVFDAFDLAPGSIIEMVGPTVSHFKNSNEKIVLCATPATIRSNIYQNAFRMIGKDIEVISVPGLAGAIEFGASGEEIEKIITSHIPDALQADVLILACTHYPLVAETFLRLFPNIQIFDPAVAVAARAKQLFWPQETGDGKTTFYISKDSEEFRKLVAGLFPNTPYSIEIV